LAVFEMVVPSKKYKTFYFNALSTVVHRRVSRHLELPMKSFQSGRRKNLKTNHLIELLLT
jgi:hypothetical protein